MGPFLSHLDINFYHITALINVQLVYGLDNPAVYFRHLKGNFLLSKIFRPPLRHTFHPICTEGYFSEGRAAWACGWSVISIYC